MDDTKQATGFKTALKTVPQDQINYIFHPVRKEKNEMPHNYFDKLPICKFHL